jgi:hypothetical protein
VMMGSRAMACPRYGPVPAPSSARGAGFGGAGGAFLRGSLLSGWLC